ncbi:MAG: hypothetical protein V3W41_04485 [Planctomycetota bacterium]
MHSAECDGCSKTWQVPAANRPYKCKECGGRVSVPIEWTETRTAYDEAPPKSPAPQNEMRSSRQKMRKDGDHERQDDILTIRKSRRVIVFLKTWFGFSAFLAVIHIALLVLLLVAVAIVTENGSEDVEIETETEAIEFGFIILIGLGIACAKLFVSFAGFLRAKLEPFLWAFILTSLQGFSVLVHLLDFELRAVIFQSVLMALFVGLTIQAKALQEALDSNPDLFTSLSGAKRHAKGKVRAAASARKSRARSSSGALTVLGIVGALTIALMVGLYLTLKTENIEDRAESFEQAWNNEGADKITAFGAGSKGASRLQKRLSERGWSSKRPVIRDARIEKEGRVQLVSFKMGKDTFTTRWARSEKTWIITKFDMPAARTTESLDEKVRSFAVAWNSGDVEIISNFFAPDRRARFKKSLKCKFDREDWHGKAPKSAPTGRREDRKKSSYIYLETEAGVVRTSWKVQKGHWFLIGIRFP